MTRLILHTFIILIAGFILSCKSNPVSSDPEPQEDLWETIDFVEAESSERTHFEFDYGRNFYDGDSLRATLKIEEVIGGGDIEFFIVWRRNQSYFSARREAINVPYEEIYLTEVKLGEGDEPDWPLLSTFAFNIFSTSKSELEGVKFSVRLEKKLR